LAKPFTEVPSAKSSSSSGPPDLRVEGDTPASWPNDAERRALVTP
jgi:hypothetical protein